MVMRKVHKIIVTIVIIINAIQAFLITVTKMVIKTVMVTVIVTVIATVIKTILIGEMNYFAILSCRHCQQSRSVCPETIRHY